MSSNQETPTEPTVSNTDESPNVTENNNNYECSINVNNNRKRDTKISQKTGIIGIIRVNKPTSREVHQG